MTVNIGPAGRSYSLPVNSFTNAASGQVISPSDANTSHADIAAGLNTALAYAQIDGQRRRMGVQAYTATPPGSPLDGQVWLVNTGGTGVFAGKDKKFAAFLSASWFFFDPVAGDEAVIVATRQGFVYDAAGVWQPGPAVPLSSTTAGRLARFTDTTGGIGQSLTSEDASGNLGVGVAASAAARLDLLASANVTARFLSSGLYSQLQIGHTGTGAVTWAMSTGVGSGTSIFGISNITGGITPLVIDPAGKIGLGGNIIPAAILDGGVSGTTQTSPIFSARGQPNSFEWGHQNGAGYACTFGFFSGSGQPYIALNAEAGTTANTFKTRGVVGRVLLGDNAGGLQIGRVTSANADNQILTVDLTIDAAGTVRIGSASIRLKSYTVATLPAASAGDICWCSNARKNGEAAAAGTGCEVRFDGTAWRSLDNTAGRYITAIA